MSGEPITTMASIRRRAVKDTRLEVVGQTKRPELVGTIRTITNPRSLSSRLYEFTSDHTADTLHVGGWPKASEVRIIDADTFEYDIHPGPGIVRLRFLPADSPAAAGCTCYQFCDETGCSLSGQWHTHPGEPCPVHPNAPGD
jgi:hypothetical protein